MANAYFIFLLVIIFVLQSSSFRLQMAAKGFGAKVGKTDESLPASADALKVSSMKQQILVIGDECDCVCQSGKKYKSCCRRIHDSKMLERGDFEAKDIIRARYSAYVIGLGPFLIDTTHRSHKDHQRYFGKTLDTKKAYKSWIKEIVTKNSAVFEFLRFEFVDDKQTEANIDQISGLDSCVHTFNVIARTRSNGEILAFQEKSTFVKDVQEDFSNGLYRKASKKDKKNTATKNECMKEKDRDNRQWYYYSGEVRVLDEETTRRLAAGIPKYSTITTVKDRW